MIRKIDILKAARSIVRHNRGYRLPVLIHPQRDWWIGLILFGTLTLGGSLFLARLYFVNQSLEGIVGVEGDTVPRYREEVVTDVLALYASRHAAYQAALGALPLAPIVEVATTTPTTATTTDVVVPSAPEAAVEEVEALLN